MFEISVRGLWQDLGLLPDLGFVVTILANVIHCGFDLILSQ